MSETIETGFEALMGRPTVEPQPAFVHPASLTPEQAAARTAAEIAEGKRQNELHANDPVEPHPSQLSDPDPAAKLLPQESEAARMNRELFDRIMAARNQPPPPPPRPQPVAPQISEQTRREMAEGARIAARHAEQQATTVRRPLNAREIAAQGTTTPVFTPGDVGPTEARPFGIQQGYRQVG